MIHTHRQITVRLALLGAIILAMGIGSPSAPTALAASARFVFPTNGYIGYLYTPTHNGLDIWTGDPRATDEVDRDPGPCGSPVRAAYSGTVYKVKKFTSYTDAPTKDDAQASIVVLRHTGVAGLPDPFFTWYLHMAKNDGTGTCISSAVWDKKTSGETIPAGFILGKQGNMKLGGDLITHLHFMISSDGNDDDTTYDPSPFLGLNICKDRANCKNPEGTPTLGYGDGITFNGAVVQGTVKQVNPTTTETDNIYFFGNQGTLVTISMARRRVMTLDSEVILYAPDGSIVARNDDGVSTLNSWISRFKLPQAGNYKIAARSFNNHTIGPFTLYMSQELASSSTLLSQRKPAYSISMQGLAYNPDRGNDGNAATRWSSRISSTDEWYWVDIGNRPFDRVYISWEAAYAAQHFIGAANSFYGLCYGRWFTTSGPGLRGYILPRQTSRYACLAMRTHAPNLGNYSFWEFSVADSTQNALLEAPLVSADAESTIAIQPPLFSGKTP